MIQDIIYIVMLLLLDLPWSKSTKLDVCGPTRFWLQSTQTCEPCSNICGLPGAYTNNCRQMCPDYHPEVESSTSATTSSTDNPRSDSIRNNLIIASAVVGGIMTFLLFCFLMRIVYRRLKAYYYWVKENKTIHPPVQESEQDQLMTQGNTQPLTDIDEAAVAAAGNVNDNNGDGNDDVNDDVNGAVNDDGNGDGNDDVNYDVNGDFNDNDDNGDNAAADDDDGTLTSVITE